MTQTRKSRLVTIRNKLAKAIRECESSRDLPALTREYRNVLAELDALETDTATDELDALRDDL